MVKYLQAAVICNQQYRHPDRRCLKLIPIISFFGYSNSGKTTVVANLTKILSGQGYRIAAIKHAAHGYDVDIPGKDSWQLFNAGAQKVLVVGLESITTHERIERDLSLQSILDRLQADENIDLILVEGFKNEPGPKIQVIRDQDAVFPDGDVDLIATVSDGPFRDDVPYYPYGQLELLAEFLAEKYLRD
ncbi:MAG: molybdopterin-guanine dinucleotide biosynthesis protein B [Syntrophomonadaceae bacterium]|nr:molybdopterin-guanine dinucleotide biosynthesis protein B [Syntrophomonadaceae bacterium]